MNKNPKIIDLTLDEPFDEASNQPQQILVPKLEAENDEKSSMAESNPVSIPMEVDQSADLSLIANNVQVLQDIVLSVFL